MTDAELGDRHELIRRDEQGHPAALATLPPGSMGNFLPKSVSELAVIARYAAQVHMFEVPNAATALNIMLAGAHLGLTPYAALEGISLVKGRPVVSAQVQWTLIQSRGRVYDFSLDSDREHCSITVWSSKWREPKTQTVRLEDVPKELFRPTRTGQPSNWSKYPEDMLFAYCIRKLRKRYFPEVMVGAVDAQDIDAVDTTAVVVEGAQVVDVGVVEEHADVAPEYVCQRDGCGEPAQLQPGKSGGMFLVCRAGHFGPPPQEVRDAIRGHTRGEAAYQREEENVVDAAAVAPAGDGGGDAGNSDGDLADAEAAVEAGSAPAAPSADADAGGVADGAGAGDAATAATEAGAEPEAEAAADTGAGVVPVPDDVPDDAPGPGGLSAADRAQRRAEAMRAEEERAVSERRDDDVQTIVTALRERFSAEERLAWLVAWEYPAQQRPSVTNWLQSRELATLSTMRREATEFETAAQPTDQTTKEAPPEP